MKKIYTVSEDLIYTHKVIYIRSSSWIIYTIKSYTIFSEPFSTL